MTPVETPSTLSQLKKRPRHSAVTAAATAAAAAVNSQNARDIINHVKSLLNHFKQRKSDPQENILYCIKNIIDIYDRNRFFFKTFSRRRSDLKAIDKLIVEFFKSNKDFDEFRLKVFTFRSQLLNFMYPKAKDQVIYILQTDPDFNKFASSK